MTMSSYCSYLGNMNQLLGGSRKLEPKGKSTKRRGEKLNVMGYVRWTT